MLNEPFESVTQVQGNPYCAHPAAREYDNFLGEQRQAICYDWSIRRWRWVVYQPLRTADYKVTPDVDKQLVEEPWDDGRVEVAAKGRVAHSANAAKRHAEARMKAIAYLMVHGPTNSRTLGEVVGFPYDTITDHLRQRAGSVYCRCRKGREVLWGVAGVHNV